MEAAGATKVQGGRPKESSTMDSSFELAAGVSVSDLSGIREGYSVSLVLPMIRPSTRRLWILLGMKTFKI